MGKDKRRQDKPVKDKTSQEKPRKRHDNAKKS